MIDFTFQNKNLTRMSLPLSLEPRSEYIDFNKETRLHVKVFPAPAGAPVVLMIHGAIENSRIFYSKDGQKGFAPFLHRNGYHVYCLDLRGKGESTPTVGPGHTYGQFSAILEEIPMVFRRISGRHSGRPLHLVCHSWGGVITASMLVRFPDIADRTTSLLQFAVKRRIKPDNAEKLFKAGLVWNRICVRLVKRDGYLNARKYGIGSDGEPAAYLRESVNWVKPSNWVGPDGFNYASAAETQGLPPNLWLTGRNDRALGEAGDVKRFMEECSVNPDELVLLSKSNGNRQNYDHINILTHPDAEADHFRYVLGWMKQTEDT